MSVHNVSQVGVYGVTLTANTEEVVQFVDDVSTLEILNMDGAAAVYFAVNRGAATVAGAHCRVLPAAVTSVLFEPSGSDPTTVSLISSGTPTVSVARA
jgi:hypothetical protein